MQSCSSVWGKILGKCLMKFLSSKDVDHRCVLNKYNVTDPSHGLNTSSIVTSKTIHDYNKRTSKLVMSWLIYTKVNSFPAPGRARAALAIMWLIYIRDYSFSETKQGRHYSLSSYCNHVLYSLWLYGWSN